MCLGLVYLAVMIGHLQSIDGLLVYRQAAALAFQHSIHFPTPVWWGAPFTTSKYGIGLSLLYLPGLLVLSPLQSAVPVQHGATYDFSLLYADPVFAVAASWMPILVAVATAFFVARFLRELGFSLPVALFGLALYGLGPGLIVARSDTSLGVSGLCWVVALYGALRWRHGARGWLIASAVAVGYAVVTRPVEGTLLLPAVLAVALLGVEGRRWRIRGWTAGATLIAGYLAGIAVTLVVDWLRYGSPLTTGYGSESWTTPLWVGLPGALISPARGLLWEFPAIVLAPLGARMIWRAGHRPAAIALVGLSVVELLNVAAWDAWWGSWGWGLRLFTPGFPLLAILGAAGAAALWAGVHARLLPALLLVLTFIWALPTTVVDLLGGYAARHDGTTASFKLSGYPPVGAWRFVHHLRALNPLDSQAVDVVWFRYARPSHNATLFVPFLLLAVVILLAYRFQIRLNRRCSPRPAG